MVGTELRTFLPVLEQSSLAVSDLPNSGKP